MPSPRKTMVKSQINPIPIIPPPIHSNPFICILLNCCPANLGLGAKPVQSASTTLWSLSRTVAAVRAMAGLSTACPLVPADPLGIPGQDSLVLAAAIDFICASLHIRKYES